MYSKKTTLLLDMNSTFMFGEDNFGESEDFSKYYHEIGGVLSSDEVNHIIRSIYVYLDKRYPDINYRHTFPTLKYALESIIANKISDKEISNIIQTFAHHEMGHIPNDYVDVLHQLSEKCKLAVVIDIWAPKYSWQCLFDQLKISQLFMASSFSSDHGMVKPSPKPYELVIAELGVNKEECLIVGDSIRRDLGGAIAAGVDCILVGDANHENAVGNYENLLAFNAVLHS